MAGLPVGPIASKKVSSAQTGRARSPFRHCAALTLAKGGVSMDNTTLLIIIIIVLLVLGGGWYGRGRWF
jgi:hypothetical protein